MKKIYLALMSIAVLAVFANCGNNNSSGASANIGASCYYQDLQQQTTTYNSYTNNTYSGLPCTFNWSSISGFTAVNGSLGSYGSTYGSVYGGTSTSCSTNQDMVYSGTRGVGCVSNTQLSTNGQPAIYMLNASTQSFTLYSAPNAAYLQMQQQYAAYPQYANSTYGQLAYGGSTYGTSSALMTSFSSLLQTTSGETLRVCDNSETCPSGQACRSPFGAAVPVIGVCYFN